MYVFICIKKGDSAGEGGKVVKAREKKNHSGRGI